MQLSILDGIYTDKRPDIRRAFPVNLQPIASAKGMAAGYLRPYDGITSKNTSPGIDRGGIVWQGNHYRVCGNSLVQVSATGAITTLGSIPGNELVSMDYSFNRLAICAAGGLNYWDGTLTPVTDPDLGLAIDMVQMDGYFVTTDGASIVVTELNDPTQVNPLKYGSSEADPDPIVALKRVRKELYAVNRYTTEVFGNVGGEFFPFAVIDGAQIQKGAVGTKAVAVLADSLVMVGGARNEAVAVYLAANATATKISTREIDEELQALTDVELAALVVETKIERGTVQVLIHLPTKTLAYDLEASKQLQNQVWFVLSSAAFEVGKYQARNLTFAYQKWWVGDTETEQIGVLDELISTHWGNPTAWEFVAQMVYNKGSGAIFHELEIVSLPGKGAFGVEAQIGTDYSIDGLKWSQRKYITAGRFGQTGKRLCWYQQGFMRQWRVQRFVGTSDARLPILALECRLEPLQ
jgi:hypothetical protein